MYDRSADVIDERYGLSMARIRQIEGDQSVPEPFRAYFRETAGFICRMDEIRQRLKAQEKYNLSLAQWQEENRAMYADILPENYANSYANPSYAEKKLGAEYGQVFSFLTAQIRGLIGYHFDDFTEGAVIHLELFLEVYNRFELDPLPQGADIKQMLYWFVMDSLDVLAAQRVRQGVDPALDTAVKIVMESDLTDLRYLYHYGEYVTDNEIQLAKYMNGLSEEEIDRMARTYTEGYRIGFVRAGKDLAKKLTVNIRYHIGFERMVRRAVEQFAQMGLRPVIYRYALSCVNQRGGMRIGYTGAIPNQQYDYDHREDAALYLDRRFMERRLGVMRQTYELFKTLSNAHAGPACIDTFGETPFVPDTKPEAPSLSEKQQQIQAEMNNALTRLTNQYIIGEERSFTIIAFPVPEIGPRFEEIFRDTMRVNTLDMAQYEQIQQRLIDALDHGSKVHVLGKGANRTDLTVALQSLEDPLHETLFENCLADVNIPVGEVFTTPRLEGTNGTLHVTQVYLEGLDYQDLTLVFTDGKISDYSCGNFSDPAEGRAYIRSNVLFHHETLPMGEFAIGTNTDAYVMAGKYGIGARLPILIAEKTGPHFAVGDTCYSFEEDLPVFNPDGKECIARDNAISILRKEDPAKAYFGCHTDITIPYSELGLIEVIDEAGNAREIIRDGRFVLAGTHSLNEALDTE